jgi:outer membrane protein OmpA-like peptidoglycan-associated protein
MLTPSSKLSFLFILIVSLNGTKIIAQGQQTLIQDANEEYRNENFLEAIEYYEKAAAFGALPLSSQFNLGISFFKTFQNEKARSLLGPLSDNALFRDRYIAMFYYASLTKEEGQYENALALFDQVLAQADLDESLLNHAEIEKRGCELAIRQLEVERGYTLTVFSEINSEFYDFGAVMNPGDQSIVFATTRNTSGGQNKDARFKGLTPNLISMTIKNGKWKENSKDSDFDQLNTRWSEGSGSFTSDGTLFYFSSCQNEGNADCKIYMTKFQDGKWGDPLPLNTFVNERNTNNKQPSISPGGDTLMFTSDRAGGFGGSDIWMSIKQDDWTPAVNLGSEINTPDDEITPYFSVPSNVLLFSSNGHPGYGGYDIYAAKLDNFLNPVLYHIGLPFNSTKNDTYFNVSDTLCFISTNRENTDNLDINYLTIKEERPFIYSLLGDESLLTVESLNPKPEVAKIEVKPIREEEKSSVITQQKLSFKEDRFENIYFDFAKYELKPKSQLALDTLVAQLSKSTYSSIHILAYTDQIGTKDYNDRLSQNRGNEVKLFLIQNGIPEEKIEVQPRGEIPGTDKEHWFNRIIKRRVEIRVRSESGYQFNLADIFIARKGNTLSQSAIYFNRDQAYLQEWNNFTGTSIPAGNTIRIYPPYDHLLDSEVFVLTDYVKKLFPN